MYSNEPRCLIFHTALLAPKTTRSAQGVAVMTLKPKYHLETVLLSEETSITNRTATGCGPFPPPALWSKKRIPRISRLACCKAMFRANR